jgi:hypothetical protein
MFTLRTIAIRIGIIWIAPALYINALAATYNEAIDGDLSGNRLAPTTITLDSGSNLVTGTFGISSIPDVAIDAFEPGRGQFVPRCTGRASDDSGANLIRSKSLAWVESHIPKSGGLQSVACAWPWYRLVSRQLYVLDQRNGYFVCMELWFRLSGYSGSRAIGYRAYGCRAGYAHAGRASPQPPIEIAPISFNHQRNRRRDNSVGD